VKERVVYLSLDIKVRSDQYTRHISEQKDQNLGLWCQKSNLIADTVKVLMVWIDHINHSTPISEA
jgi:hypothetical protein